MLDGARILVAEDEAVIAWALADAFADAGAEVVGPAASVREALQLLDHRSIDVAILDVNLLDGEVTPIAERLIAQGVPVLIYSGRGAPADLRSRHPSLPVLQKPVRLEVLCRTLADLLRRYPEPQN
jgi:DNA-binding response OmpR family regulator